MFNLDDWIGRQIKRGYTRNQIKNYLVRARYPDKYVAHVDNYVVGKSVILKTKNHKVILKIVTISILLIFSMVGSFIYFSNVTIIEVEDDISNGLNYTIYSGNYVGNENGIIILENGGIELRVIHETPKSYFQIYKRQKNGDDILIDKKKPELGTPLILYVVSENNKQKIRKVVINDQDNLT